MKRVVIIINLLLLLSVPGYSRDRMDDVWDHANHAYTNGDYKAAIEAYDSIQQSGYASAKLYYNLGNAYFKDNQVGKAILNYNKAQRLDPSDDDIKHNLAVANSQVKDRIEVVPEFFFKTWMRSLMFRASSDNWAVLSLVFLAVALALVAVYLLSGRLGYRKTGFYGGILFVLFFIGSVVFASIQRRMIVSPDQAVIMATAASVKSSPDQASKDIFVLHEGTRVRVVGEMGQWREIVIADGNKGWIDGRSIEMIN